ncbi:glutathione S-transferase T3-like [Panicum miliaceum]|uniref:Glutathione S-transferase T3-like n=1 Tax=Panicum miliaceum TaxID=4540 RepID=A0A3L6QB26_PANMI|nr:glutathione S-transferase T3-like [Panicum miliaceum]
MDPIQGVEQSQTSYWARIHKYFHANKSFELDRTQGSLMNRWSGIQHDVNIFCGCVTRIEDRNQSGCSVDDKIAHACTLFKAEDKKNRKFALMHCWRILKDKPKWMKRCKQIGASKTVSNKKQKTKTNSSPSSAAPVLAPGTGGVDAAPAQDPSKRPDGKKMEKKKLRQRLTIEALDYLVAKMKETDAEKELKKVLCSAGGKHQVGERKI